MDAHKARRIMQEIGGDLASAAETDSVDEIMSEVGFRMAMDRSEKLNKAKLLLRDSILSMEGYRREMDDHQPCDAESAAKKWLAELALVGE